MPAALTRIGCPMVALSAIATVASADAAAVVDAAEVDALSEVAAADVAAAEVDPAAAVDAEEDPESSPHAASAIVPIASTASV